MPVRARRALIGAAALLVLLLLTYVAAFHVGFVEHADRAVLQGFAGIGHKPRVNSLAWRIATLCDPTPYVYFCVIPVGIALWRRRWRLAAAIFAILLGANVTTQLFKPLLAVHRSVSLYGTGIPPLPASWPSGHATAAMSLALCCVLASPARLRPFVAALGAAFAVAVSYSFLSLAWHYPSDVLGGYLVAGVWTLLGAAGVFMADAARGPRTEASAAAQRLTIRELIGPPSAALLAAVLLALIVVIARPHEVVTYAHLHKTFVLGAAAIGTLALALATGVTFAIRR
jgi:membrane-associated phospholipid phosphatase